MKSTISDGNNSEHCQQTSSRSDGVESLIFRREMAGCNDEEARAVKEFLL